MQVLHVIDTIDPKAGGPSWMIVKLTARQVAADLSCDVFYFDDPDRRPVVEQFVREQGDPDHVNVHPLNQPTWTQRLRSAWLAATLRSHIRDKNAIIHTHGLWGSLILTGCLAATKLRLPYIIRPAGMLEPWSLAQKKWRKRLAMIVAFRRILNRAAALHATAVSEAQQYRKLGLTAPIAVIPNGVESAPYEQPPRREWIDQQWPQLAGKSYALFLSRIHHKKGLHLLVPAWARLCKKYPDWHLVIAGAGDATYEAQLRQMLVEAAIADRVTFVGAVYDDAKVQLLINSGLFVLPTFSENFGVVITEAMAAGVPVITTHGTPWREIEELGCGLWIELDESRLYESLDRIMSMSPELRREMGLRGRKLVRDKYSIQSTAARTVEMYDWIAGGKPMPSFIYPGDLPHD